MKYNFIKFFIIFFLIVFINPNILISATSEDKIFEVKNISVEIESTSSSKAREIALLEAQEKGFKNLMKKMLLESEYEKIETINIEKILEFVDAIEIQNEKTTASKYLGSLTVMFNEEKVLRYLNRNEIRFASLKSKPLLILPIYKFAGVTYLWEKKNKVSSHFLISKKGEIFYLVDLKKRAWHAGVSGWKGYDDINSRSIGIEIVNSGEKCFPDVSPP